MISLVSLTALGFLTLTAALIDGRTGRIPNWLTLAGGILSLGIHGVSGGLPGLVPSVVGAALCGLVPFVLYWASRGTAIGGGDLKLFLVLGALLGPELGLSIQFSSYVLVSTFAMLRLTYEGKLWQLIGHLLILAARPFRKPAGREAPHPLALTEIRLGPFIFLASVLAIASEHLHLSVPWLAI